MTLPPEDEFTNLTIKVPDVETTTINDAIDNDTVFDSVLGEVAMALNVYYTPILIILGCVGNILSVGVFYRSKLRLQSTSQYLSALALSDTLFLCQLLPPWLKATGASTLFTRPGYCQVFVYMTYVTCNLSAWLVVAFTVERFVAVVYPLQRNAMCTVKRARYIIGLLAVGALLVNVPVLRFAVTSANDCNIDELLMDHAARFNVVDTMVAFTLPLFVITVLNAWIMWTVYRVHRARPDLVRQETAGRPRGPHAARASAYQRSQQRVTRMLLIVSSVFVLLNLPAYTMRMIAYAKNMSESEYSGRWAALQQVCLLFFNTNFGINFVLYCLTGQNFRRALRESIPRLWRRRRARGILRGTGDRPARASSISTSFAHSFSTNYPEATSSHQHTCSVAGPSGVQSMGGRGRQASTVQTSVEQSGDGRNYSRRTGPGRVQCALPSHRRRNKQKVIQRWKFDNSRQRRQSLEQQQERERRESMDMQYLGQRESFGMQHLGSHEAIEMQYLGSRDAIEMRHLGSHEAIEMQYLGQRDAIEIRHLGSHEAIEMQYLRPRDAIEMRHLGQRDEIETRHLGQRDEIETRHLGQRESIEIRHPGPSEAIEMQHLGQRDSVETQHLGQRDSIEMQHPRQRDSIETRPLGPRDAIEMFHLGSREAIEIQNLSANM